MENDRSFVGRVAKQRQRFTPWLVEQIERGDIDGLEWIDKDQGKFRVPWVRVDKPEFQLETHAELFKRWAQHTGKYRPGDQPDPSTWKTRFRCALRKMQEIVEIKDQGNLEGNKPHRVFKFEPKLKGMFKIKARVLAKQLILIIVFTKLSVCLTREIALLLIAFSYTNLGTCRHLITMCLQKKRFGKDLREPLLNCILD